MWLFSYQEAIVSARHKLIAEIRPRVKNTDGSAYIGGGHKFGSGDTEALL